MFEYPVKMACGVEFNNKIYMSSIILNGLFEYDIQRESLKYISPFVEESAYYALHKGCLAYGDEIWFIPQHGKKIAVFNTKTEGLSYIKPEYEKEYKSPLDNLPTISYSYGTYETNMLFILPASIDAVNIINMKTKKVESINNVLNQGEYFSAGIYHDGLIHAFTGDGKWRVEINPYKYTAKRFKWDLSIVSDIKWIDETGRYYISSIQSKEIITANKEFSDISTYTIEQDTNEKFGIGYEMVYNHKLYLFPWGCSKTYRFDLDSMKFTKLEIQEEKNIAINYNPVQSDNYIIGTTETVPYIVIMDEKEKTMKTIPMKADMLKIQENVKKAGLDIKKVFWNNDHLIINEKNVNLSDFITFVDGL